MAILCGVFVFVLLKSSTCLDIWHPYDHEDHVREELVITNITSDDRFKLEYDVIKWKSLRLEKTCYAAGLTERNVVIASIKLNERRFSQESYVIELEGKPVDVDLFEHWNETLKKSEAVLVVALEKNTLQWFKLENTNFTLFWSWPLEKDISHINVFQINYDFHILIITTYLNLTTADLYEFKLENSPNFWLLQIIPLQEPSVSTFINKDPDHFLAFTQPSIDSVFVYKLRYDHFLPFKNLTSESVNQVVSFKIGHKAFLAFNGFNSGIYQFAKNDLIEEKIANSHFDGVNYWLPIEIVINEEKTLLLAQRSLDHGFHQSFVVEIFTYNGKKFEEHEDIHCLYFGEEILGLSCLPGLKGIKGATSVYIDGVLGLLIPRSGNFSELFLFKAEVKKIQNPIHKQLEDFIQRRETLSNVMAVQEQRYEEMVAKSRRVKNFEYLREKLEEMSRKIDLMKATLNNEQYKTIIFKEPVRIKSDAVFDEVEVNKIKGKLANEVFGDIVMKNNMKTISSLKTFAELKVENLFSENINQIDTKDLLFTSTKNLTINGDLILEKTLVSGNIDSEKVNSRVLEKEIFDLNSPIEKLVFENVEILGDASVDQLDNFPLPSSMTKDSLFVPYNIEVESVNGENFNTFLQQLCLKNIKNYIPGTTKIKGDVIVKSNAQTAYLNSLKFPEDYVFSDNSFPNITGQKYFANTLKTSELKSEGTVNNVNTSEIITLSTDQQIPKTTTFKNLQITERLKVDGKVYGEDASKFLPNPTLLEENSIKANVNFKNLTVEGNIVISEDFNGENLQSLLRDVIYKNEKNAVIEAVKQFPEGFKISTDLSVTSNSINDIDINSIVTKDTVQELNITTLHGIADFGSIEIDGLYDFVDIKKLDEEIVKLNGEQYISSTLIFEDEIEVNELEVTESINGLEELLTSTENQQNPIEAEEITVEGNIFGNIDGFDLAHFHQNRLSLSQDQEIKSDYNIKHLTVKYLDAEKINDLDFYEFTRDSFEDKLHKKLRSSKLKVKNLYVEGPLEIDRINDRSTINLGGSLWKNDLKKYNITKLSFYEDTYFNTVEIDRLSNVSFDLFINSLVFKNETNPTIKGVKTFLQGITVEKLIETEKLNNISLPNLLTRQGAQEITGPLVIHGNITFDNDVTISQNLNDILLDLLTENYKEKENEYTVRGDFLFNRLPHIFNLKLQGSANNKPAKEVIDGIVYKNEDFKLPGNTTFENDVSIEKNFIVNKTNNIDLAAFAASVVMTTKDTDIMSPVRFQEVVNVEKLISVSNNLETKLLDGVNLETWLENGIFINKGFLRGHYKFDEVEIVDALHTEYLNNVNMSTLIPLRSEQNLGNLTFQEVATFNDILVGNSTNFQDLRSEFINTVFTSSEQNIDSDLEFLGEVFIEGNIELTGLLNRIKTDKIVTTNTDQELTSIYNFRSKVILEKNLQVEKVNGINISQWLSEGVRLKSETPENITDDWMIRDELILEDNVTGNGLINGLDLRKFREEVEQNRRYKYAMEKGFIDDYGNICKDLTFMYDRMKRQIYKFNYLESLQVLELKNRIQHVYHFNHRNNVYLLLNEEKSCKSHLYIFREGFRFVQSMDLGMVEQIISVHNNEFIHFVVRSEGLGFCEAEGTNVWEFVEDDFVHVANMESLELLQDSLVPGTFYGIRGFEVVEFKIVDQEPRVRKYRKWQVKENNMAFVPRGLSTGLSLRTGRKLIKLSREDPIIEDFNHNFENIIIGNFTEEVNTHLPGRKSGDLIPIKIANRKTLLAVATHEETSVKGSLDFIKIYEDVISGKVFHKVPTYNPSSLVVLDLNNYETLLIFMEDEKVLQVYEYKGIEGFKHKLAVKVEGSKLMTLQTEVDGRTRRMLGLVNGNKVTIMEAVMLGDKVEDDLYCHL